MPTTFMSALVYVMFLQGAGPIPIKYDPMAVAWADCQRLPPHQRPYVRYIWINPNLAPTMTERQQWWQELSIGCWRLSREQVIQTGAVAPVDKDFLVFRIDTLAVGWHDRRDETLERLVDPYMTYALTKADAARVQPPDLVQDGKNWRKVKPYKGPDGRTYEYEEIKDVGKVAGKTALAPWYDGETTKLLAEATQSRMPLMRADWFWNQSQTDADKLIGYSAFLGVKNEKDFDRLVGRFDADLKKRFQAEYVEAASKVEGKSPTHHPRLIEAEMAAGGPYWRTGDNRLPQGRSNPFKTIKLKDGDFLYEGRESLGHLPNGLLAAGAFAGNLDFDADVLKKKANRTEQGTRADVAPDFLASDRFAPDTDRRIHVGMSCWRCHENDPIRQKEFIRLYQSDLEAKINLSRQIYANAVMQATTMTGVDAEGRTVVVVKGLTTEAESNLIGDRWRKYENARVDLNYAAADLMMTPGQAVTALKNIKTLTGQISVDLDNFISGNLPLTIRQWEELYGQAKFVSTGVAPQ